MILSLTTDMALQKRSGQKRKSPGVRGESGRSAPMTSRMPSPELLLTETFLPNLQVKEEDDFVVVEPEPHESMMKKLQLQIESLEDDKETLKKAVNHHLSKEVEMQNRIAHLEKQSSMTQYRDNELQARMEEVEAKLDRMKLEKSRLEDERSALKTEVECQQKTFDQTVERQAYKISLLEDESQVMTERIQQLEEANKLFVMVAQNVKEGLWKAEQSGGTIQLQHSQVCGALQSLSHTDSLALPPDVSLPEDANIPPVSTETLVEFIPEMAPKWEFIGHKLGLAHKVMALRNSEQPAESKCLAMLAEWVQAGREVTWQELLKVLTNSGILLYSVAYRVKQHLLGNVL